MKQLATIIFAFLFISPTFSQTVYESPHVKDGKTIQFEIPEGQYKVKNDRDVTSEIFVPIEGVDPEDTDLEELGVGVLLVMHESKGEKTLADIKEEIGKGLIEKPADVVVLEAPTVRKINGLECVLVAVKGKLNGQEMHAAYIGVTEFGDYNVMFLFMAQKENETNISYKKFQNILGSWKIVDTDKEDEMPSPEEYTDFMADDEEYESGYKNDYYETTLTYFDVLPDFGEDWDEPYDENSHVLCTFVYKETQGTMHVFSGGSATDYPSNNELAGAVQKVIGLSSNPDLTYSTQFRNPDHTIKYYTIKGGGKILALYTTIVAEEMVFFVVESGTEIDPAFESAHRKFMDEMWVDYPLEFDEVEAPPIGE